MSHQREKKKPERKSNTRTHNIDEVEAQSKDKDGKEETNEWIGGAKELYNPFPLVPHCPYIPVK